MGLMLPLTTQSVDWVAIAPPLIVALAALVVLAVGARRRPTVSLAPIAIAFAGLALAACFVPASVDHPRTTFCTPTVLERVGTCSWQVDNVTTMWWIVVLLGAFLVGLLLAPQARASDLPAAELYFLLLISVAGAMAIPAAGDLITLVVALETLSLPAFALVGLRAHDRRGAESAVKFFLVSVVSTAVTLMGISLIYGAVGSVYLSSVALAGATDSAPHQVLVVGIALTAVGFGFKIAAVPFQVWVPDTYVGAPIPVAAYLSVVSKAGGLAGLLVFLVRGAPAFDDVWGPVLGVVAALTMTLGNVAALRQRHAVRLLAWSSVAQAGYLLVPFVAGVSTNAAQPLLAYALMYAVVNLGAFAVVAAVSRLGAVTIDDYAGLARRHPWAGVSLVFSLLCLAGLPPGVVGLIAKLVIFNSAVSGGASWLAVVMAVNVAIGLMYYLRWIVIVLRPAERPTALDADLVEAGTGYDVAIGLTVTVAVALSLYPAPLFTLLS
jgi:NADH-quinone oxidoreductase subunit N